MLVPFVWSLSLLHLFCLGSTIVKLEQENEFEAPSKLYNAIPKQSFSQNEKV